jgi:cation diffusion facilitator family transporter
VLWLVLGLNAVMFVVEILSGWIGKSLALTGDGLDMLGDAVAYGSSLWVITRGASSPTATARSAQLKGLLMLATGLAAFGQAVYLFIVRPEPDPFVIGPVAAAALAVNLVCLFALTRHKNDDLNMSSVWLCSRNDIIANVAVLGAGGAVYATGSAWPDLVVGVLIMALFLQSAVKVLAAARAELARTVPAIAHGG